MPTPKKGETEKEFISRCIPYVLKEGTAKDQKQAIAICYSMWRKRHGGAPPTNKEEAGRYKTARAS